MPYFTDTSIGSYYHSSYTKLDIDLARDTQITNNFFIKAEIHGILATKTVPQDIIGSGLNQMHYALQPYYRLMPELDIVAEYEYQKNYGAFKNLQTHSGGSDTEKSLTFGLAVLF